MKGADRTAFPDVILMDNAFQHVRDLSIDMSSSFRDGRKMPERKDESRAKSPR